jgi:hypothetical protein
VNTTGVVNPCLKPQKPHIGNWSFLQQPKMYKNEHCGKSLRNAKKYHHNLGKLFGFEFARKFCRKI